MRVRACSAFLAALLTLPPLARGDAPGVPLLRRLELGGTVVQGRVTALARHPDGTLWVGSNVLAVQDSDGWTTLDIPGAYAFRALAPAADGRMWFGAVGTIGYVRRDACGDWQVCSLVSELRQAGMTDIGDVWFAAALGDAAVFVTSDTALRWDGRRWESWSLPSAGRLRAFVDGEAVLVYRAGTGLWRLRASGPPETVLAEAELPATPVTCYARTQDGGAVIGLGEEAFRMSWPAGQPPRFTPLVALSAALRDAVPTSAVTTGDAGLVIGTLKHGLICADLSGRVQASVDASSGLRDDNIYTLWADPAGPVLAGTESDAAVLEPTERVTAVELRDGEVAGEPLRVLGRSDGTVAVLTNRALYAPTAAGISRVIEPQAALWDAIVVDGETWIGGFGGLWRVGADGATHEHHVSADVPRLLTSRGFPGAIVFIENYSLRALERAAYGWVPRELGPRLTDTPISLVEDQAGDLWVSTMVGAIHRYAWEPRPQGHPLLRSVALYRPGAGLHARAARPQLTRLGRDLIAFTADGIWRLNAARSAFEPVPELDRFVGLAAADPANGASAFWLVRSRELGERAGPVVIRVSAVEAGQPLEWAPVSTPGLETLGPVSAFSATDAKDGGVLWIGGRTRLLRYPVETLAPVRSAPAIALRQVTVDGTALPLGDRLLQFPGRGRRIVFTFAARSNDGGPEASLQTRLAGVDANWSEPGVETRREFVALPAGPYRLEGRSVDRFGRSGPEWAQEFVIPAPWHRHPAAITGFGLLGLGAVAAGLRWRLLRLRRLNARLERLVSDRTHELEMVNSARGEFLEGISHELRNPLNGLNGLLDLLQEDRLGTREREIAVSLRACAGQLTRVFEEVLGYARLESGLIRLSPRAFSVRALLQEIADLFAVSAAANGGSVRVVLPEAFMDGFEADANRIKTVLTNFAGNAVKYAPGAAIELTAEAIPAPSGRVDLHFEVTDQGPGIPAEEQELIFQKFVRGSNARRTGIAGTGLGLATCRMLARALNGDVGVESELGHGATFYLRVPVSRAVPPPVAVGRASDEPDRCDVSTSPVGIALVVDDEDYNRTVMRGIALSLGYEVAEAATGAEALARAGERRFDVVFLDWELPDSSGGEIAGRIRAGGGEPRPWIIATTAHDGDEMPERCAAAGMDGYLLKPCRREQVSRLLDRLRSGGSAGSEAGGLPEKAAAGLSFEAFDFFAQAAPARAGEAAALFVAAVERELGQLSAALQAGNGQAAGAAAHRLRGLGGIIGATALVRIAAQIETEARARNMPAAREAHAALAEEWGRLRPQVASVRSFTPRRG